MPLDLGVKLLELWAPLRAVKQDEDRKKLGEGEGGREAGSTRGEIRRKRGTKDSIKPRKRKRDERTKNR